MLCKRIAVITGDVHHPLSRSWWDQKEADFALEYVNIARELGIKVTLFVTGRCIEQRPEIFNRIINECSEHVELGAHTYWAFKEIPIISTIVRRYVFPLFKVSLYGPPSLQEMDIGKAIRAFEKWLGFRPKVWRTHCYAGTKKTYEILAKHGVIAVSDRRVIAYFKVKKEVNGLYHVYITMPHDEVIEPDMQEKNREWRESVFNLLRGEILRGACVVFNLHPKRMKMLDDFETFIEIIRMLKRNNYEFLTVSEVVEMYKGYVESTSR